MSNELFYVIIKNATNIYTSISLIFIQISESHVDVDAVGRYMSSVETPCVSYKDETSIQ